MQMYTFNGLKMSALLKKTMHKVKDFRGGGEEKRT